MTVAENVLGGLIFWQQVRKYWTTKILRAPLLSVVIEIDQNAIYKSPRSSNAASVRTTEAAMHLLTFIFVILIAVCMVSAWTHTVWICKLFQIKYQFLISLRLNLRLLGAGTHAASSKTQFRRQSINCNLLWMMRPLRGLHSFLHA